MFKAMALHGLFIQFWLYYSLYHTACVYYKIEVGAKRAMKSWFVILVMLNNTSLRPVYLWLFNERDGIARDAFATTGKAETISCCSFDAYLLFGEVQVFGDV